MAQKIHRAQIGERETIAANGTSSYRWNNPPSGLVSYFVKASPPAASGPHGTSSCEVIREGWRVHAVADLGHRLTA
jgi:hypothetical protein